MNLEKMSEELAKGVKTQEDLSNIMGQLAKTVLEAALNGEMQSYLGYKKHQKAPERKNNTRNGTSSKTLKTEHGELNLAIPRDRNAGFEPRLIPKGKTRLEGVEKTILNLYTMGMTTRDIQESIKDLYHGVNISHEVISNVTDVVTDEVKAWQNRPLDAVYPILYMDGIVIKVYQQMALFADRTSSKELAANQLRLWFASMAYVLISALRRKGLQGTEWAKAQCDTIRLKLFKIGAFVKISCRRIYIQMSSAYPYQELFMQTVHKLKE